MEENRKVISKFLRDFAVTQEFADKNPDQADEAWSTFKEDWELDDTKLAQLRQLSVQIRLDPTTD